MFLVKPSFFTYKPLVAPDAFRLALFYPASDVLAVVECSIEHATLSQYDQDLIHHYTALSYVWGEPTDTRQINISGCPFHITATLESALRHLRDAKRVIRIWADALCINQADVEERSQQVSQMGSIYSVARHTIIYLGDSTETTDSIFSEIGSLGTSGNVPLPIDDLHSKYSDAALEALVDGLKTQIIQRPWFTRVWVFQELLLSRDPWLQCGTKRLKWGTLSLFLNLLHTGDYRRVDIPEEVDVVGRLEEIVSARQTFQDSIVGKGEGNPLLAVLVLRRGLGVSDARDMIYAHLGIVSDSLSGHLELKVDYSKSCPELFTDATRYFLKRYKDLRILSYIEDVNPQKRRQNLPSWVPDWTSNIVSESHYYNRIRNKNGLGNFSFSLSAEGKHQLISEGYITGRIGMIGSNILSFAYLNSDDIRRSWSRILNTRHHSVGVDWRGKYRKGRNKHKKSFEMLVEEAAEAAGLQNSPSFRTRLHLYRDHFEESLLDLLPPGRDATNMPHALALLFGIPFYLGDTPKLGDIPGPTHFRMLQDALSVLEGKRLCLVERSSSANMESDQIALVPQWAQTGDLICVLGDWHKVLVRPIESSLSSEKESANEHVTLVGTCYQASLRGSSSTCKTFFVQ
jgi:hypothetical protein